MTLPGAWRGVVVRVGRRRVLVSRPDASSDGQLSLDVLATIGEARRTQAAACLLAPAPPFNTALLSLTAGDVPVVPARGMTGAWLSARWALASARRRSRARLEDLRLSAWQELEREFRRHAADQSLPGALRTRLRGFVRWTQGHSTAHGPHVFPYPRRELRERTRMVLPDALVQEARDTAKAAGVSVDRPTVAMELRGRLDTFLDAIAYLTDRGYQIVRIGRAAHGPVHHPNVVDPSASPAATLLLDVFVLLTSRFALCSSVDLQRVTYLTNTPAVTVNAPDPFSAYPLREDGIFALRQVIDLDSGRHIGRDEQLTEVFARNARNCGYRDTPAAQVRAAVEEMEAGLDHGWHESQGQSRFRQRVADAGAHLASWVPDVAAWGPDRGFIGDGRLARCQADDIA